MTAKKWFSENDVNAARERLSALPDLTRERLTRAEVLGQLRDDSPTRIQGVNGFRRLKIKLRQGLSQQVLPQHPGTLQHFFLPAHFAVGSKFLALHPAI